MARTRTLRIVSGAAAIVGALTLSACGSGFSSPATSGSAEATGSGPISVLIGSSGDAETTAVKSAVADWSKTSGTEASVAVASDMVQQLSQGFASGKPADVFYVSTDQFAGFAANGSLEPYGDSLANKDDFYPGAGQGVQLRRQALLRTQGFLDPLPGDQHRQVGGGGPHRRRHPHHLGPAGGSGQEAHRRPTTGLAFSPEIARVGAFFPQAGGSFVSEDGKTATVNSPENVEALSFVSPCSPTDLRSTPPTSAQAGAARPSARGSPP